MTFTIYPQVNDDGPIDPFRPHFDDEEAAYAFVESRIWANGGVCPKCGVIDQSGEEPGSG